MVTQKVNPKMNLIHQFFINDDKDKESVVAILPLLKQEQDTCNEWNGWICDEITPNLCDLTVTTGQIQIKENIFVQYWKNSVSPSKSPADNTNNNSNNNNSSSSSSSSSLSSNALVAVQTAIRIIIIIIHGGPGMAHNYILTLRKLAYRCDCYDGHTREVYFYDQSGCGESILILPTRETNVTIYYPNLSHPLYYLTIELPHIS